MIVSVPHTGTRTLERVLGVGQFYHFGQNEGDFEKIDELIHFPIRDPLATSLSWRSYQINRDDMGEFPRWEKAIACLKRRSHKVYRIEDYPVLEGRSSETHWWKQAYKNRDIKSLKSLPEVRYLLEWIEQPEIAAFFEKHYPEGFWWRKKQETLSS